MFGKMNAIVKSIAGRKSLLAAVVAMSSATLLAAPAKADHRSDRDRVGLEIHIGDSAARRWVPGVCEERAVQIWVDASYRTVCDSIYEAPVYRTVVERVWHEPVYSCVRERVYVPAQYEVRETVKYDYTGRRFVCREKVLVCDAHYDTVERKVLVSAGYHENVTRQVMVSDGRYRKVERQELVTPGHYETRTERVEVVPGRWETASRGGWDFRIRG